MRCVTNFDSKTTNIKRKVNNIMKKPHWQDGISLLAGLWIFFAPWVLGSHAGALVGNYIVPGILITFGAISGLAEFRSWKEWANILLGIWLLITPWFLHFRGGTALSWSAVVSGAVVIVCACWALSEVQGRKPLAK
jgi:SPW repeat